MKKTFIFFTFIISFSLFGQNLPKGFIYLSSIDKTIQSELRYFGENNFIGRKIEGYNDNRVIVHRETGDALHRVQQVLLNKGLSLKIFDAYRPQQAVNHFVRWAKVLSDTLKKKEYYPKVKKSELFKQGYISSKSGHSRGSSVDLTIVDLNTGKELDMGSPFDFFGTESHPHYKKIGVNHKKNRFLLRKVMIENGFRPYKNEWWHFTLKNEPFPSTYFNFSIE